MEEIILFILSFIFIFIIYEIFIVRKAIKHEKDKKNNKQPIELKYLISKYKFNLKKVNYHKLLHVIALVSSFDISLIVSLSMITNHFLLQILIIMILVIPVILLSYHIVYLVYKKRGLI